jgi:hypothetical protein
MGNDVSITVQPQTRNIEVFLKSSPILISEVDGVGSVLINQVGGIGPQGPPGQSLLDDTITASGGYVGINNANPIYNLDVSGTANFSAGIYISGVPLSTSNAQITKIKTTLPSGVESYFINFPLVLPIPQSVNCNLENDIDEFIYNYSIKSVNTSGFVITFSDYLINSGYIVNSTIFN